jgi:hypothetical protein
MNFLDFRHGNLGCSGVEKPPESTLINAIINGGTRGDLPDWGTAMIESLVGSH